MLGWGSDDSGIGSKAVLNIFLQDTAVCKNCKAKGKTPELYQKHVSC